MAGLTRVGLIDLLRWQWLAYWRGILRGGTAARSNLIVLGLIFAAGFARYITLLRDVRRQTAAGNYILLELTLAGLLIVAAQPGWDMAGLALGSREMARFPLSPGVRLALRVLSRFVAPVSWILAGACLAAVWAVSALPHPALAIVAYLLLMVFGFASGVALADYSKTATGVKGVRLVWAALALASVGAWFAGVRSLPPLPPHLVVQAGGGHWESVTVCAILAALSVFAAWRSHPWMLRHAPPGEHSGQQASAARVTLFRRELRLQASLIEVRSAWVIAGALAFYLVTAARPEPDALRVMLGILGLLTIALPLNGFGLDGVPGLDRLLLWPVYPTRIFMEKNKAFATAAMTPTLGLAALAWWRFGWREGLADAGEAAAIALFMVAWGNIASVRHPENAARASGGNLVDQFIAMAAVAVPTAASIAALRTGQNAAPLYVLGVAAVGVLAYAASLRWSAHAFAIRHERMRAALN